MLVVPSRVDPIILMVILIIISHILNDLLKFYKEKKRKEKYNKDVESLVNTDFKGILISLISEHSDIRKISNIVVEKLIDTVKNTDNDERIKDIFHNIGLTSFKAQLEKNKRTLVYIAADLFYYLSILNKDISLILKNKFVSKSIDEFFSQVNSYVDSNNNPNV